MSCVCQELSSIHPWQCRVRYLVQEFGYSHHLQGVCWLLKPAHLGYFQLILRQQPADDLTCCNLIGGSEVFLNGHIKCDLILKDWCRFSFESVWSKTPWTNLWEILQQVVQKDLHPKGMQAIMFLRCSGPVMLPLKIHLKFNWNERYGIPVWQKRCTVMVTCRDLTNVSLQKLISENLSKGLLSAFSWVSLD